MTYYHRDHEEDGAYIGSIGEESKGRQEGEEDEDGQEDGVDLPRTEANTVVHTDRDTVEHPLHIMLETVGGRAGREGLSILHIPAS